MTRAELQEVVEAVREGMKPREGDPPVCPMGMTPSVVSWAHRAKKRGDKLATAFLYTMVTVVAGGTMTALWLGIKAMVK